MEVYVGGVERVVQSVAEAEHLDLARQPQQRLAIAIALALADRDPHALAALGVNHLDIAPQYGDAEAVVDGFIVWTTSDDDPVLDAVVARRLFEAIGLVLRLLWQVPEKRLRRVYWQRFTNLLRCRPDPSVMRVYAIKCAMHYHAHRLVETLQRRGSGLVMR